MKDSKLTEFLKALKEQKKRIDNNYSVQQTIRDVVKSFKSYRMAYRTYQKNPAKFRKAPRPPKPKKLQYWMYASVELNANSLRQEKETLLIKLNIHSEIKVAVRDRCT